MSLNAEGINIHPTVEQALRACSANLRWNIFYPPGHDDLFALVSPGSFEEPAPFPRSENKTQNGHWLSIGSYCWFPNDAHANIRKGNTAVAGAASAPI